MKRSRAEYNRQYYAAHREKILARIKTAQRKRRAANPEAVRAADRAFYAKAVVRKRAQRRKCYAKARVLGGKGYRARFRCRLPEWAAACQRVLDARSRFIYENATASDRVYARELAIERKA